MSAWWTIPIGGRAAISAAVLLVPILVQLHILSIRPLSVLIAACIVLLFTAVMCGGKFGPSSVYIALSLTGAAWWSGWMNVPVWLLLLSGGFLMITGIRAEEFLSRLMHIPVVGRNVSLAFLGAMIGFPLMQGYASIIDSYRASELGIRQRRTENSKKNIFVYLTGIARNLLTQVSFRTEVLVLILAEYVTKSGRQLSSWREDGEVVHPSQNANGRICLHEIYAFDSFADFYIYINTDFSLCKEWSVVLNEEIRKGFKVYEIGSGTGHLAGYVERKGAEYRGLEQNKSLYD